MNPMTDETQKVHLVKQCSCVTSSSGPRYVVRGKVNSMRRDGQIVIIDHHVREVALVYARLACDRCGEPWVEKAEDLRRLSEKAERPSMDEAAMDRFDKELGDFR